MPGGHIDGKSQGGSWRCPISKGGPPPSVNRSELALNKFGVDHPLSEVSAFCRLLVLALLLGREVTYYRAPILGRDTDLGRIWGGFPYEKWGGHHYWRC